MPEMRVSLGNYFVSYQFIPRRMRTDSYACGWRLAPSSDLARWSDPGTLVCAPRIAQGGVDGPERLRMAEPRLPLDPRIGRGHVDRPSLVLQLRQRAGGENLRSRLTEESGPGADASRVVLVPLGRRLYLGDGDPAALGRVLGRQRHGQRAHEQLRLGRHRAPDRAGRLRRL